MRRFNARVRYAQRPRALGDRTARRRAGAYSCASSAFALANVDAAGAVRAIYQRRAGTGRGTLDLSAAFDRFLIARAPRYLPSRLNAALRAYLSHALKGGIARRAILNIRGDLDHFPFQHPRAS